MSMFTLKRGLKARITRMVDFRDSFKKELDQQLRDPRYGQEQCARLAAPTAERYLANSGMTLRVATDLIDTAISGVWAAHGPASVVDTLKQVKAKLTDYASTPLTENPDQHMQAAMELIDGQLTDDLQRHITPDTAV